jgi:hypothetical protein
MNQLGALPLLEQYIIIPVITFELDSHVYIAYAAIVYNFNRKCQNIPSTSKEDVFDRIIIFSKL